MTKHLALASLAAWLVLSTLAKSQPPPPTPTVSAQDKQQERDAEQAHDSASQSNVIRTTPRDGHASSEGNNNKHDSSNHWIAIFTFVLAAAAVVQVWAMVRQAGYMRKGLGVTAKAADAAT